MHTCRHRNLTRRMGGLLVVKTVPWESEELKKRKRKLDRIHTKKPIQTLTGAGSETSLKGGCSVVA